eukprot:GFUD01085236.1.p1 GENE.GFUD01085236.1~~GFUD01085236.1.p1  ORF type:complete len:109 (+),score=4.63 GFUD01085236.1:262-588(+)
MGGEGGGLRAPQTYPTWLRPAPTQSLRGIYYNFIMLDCNLAAPTRLVRIWFPQDLGVGVANNHFNILLYVVLTRNIFGSKLFIFETNLVNFFDQLRAFWDKFPNSGHM